MRFSTSSFVTLSTLTVQICAASLPQIRDESSFIVPRAGKASYLPLPSQDPWFQPPLLWQLQTPGTALKTRTSPYPTIAIGNAGDTFQVLYRTQDTNSNPSWAVTTVFIPASHAKCSTDPSSCSHSIVTYEVPYDTVDTDATPSYLLQYAEPYGEMYDMLTRGWFVSTPDYEGPTASYGAGIQSAHATLDSMRAVLQVSSQFGLNNKTARSAIWGYSGGASAADFAAEIAGSYAPDLQIAGIVAGGTTPNIITAGNHETGGGAAGLAIAGIIGITNQHPVATAYINSRLKTVGPYNITGFYSALHMTGAQLLTGFAGAVIGDYFIGGANDLASPILLNLYNTDALMGVHGTPKVPMFIYKAINDQISNGNETDDLVNTYCAKGANILYHRNKIGGHNQELFSGRLRVLDYLSTVLDHTNAMEVPQTGCLTKTVTIAYNVTTKFTHAYEGKAYVGYNAVTLVPVDVTVKPDGTVLETQANGQVVKVNPASFY